MLAPKRIVKAVILKNWIKTIHLMINKKKNPETDG
jgi:hypothetical protein